MKVISFSGKKGLRWTVKTYLAAPAQLLILQKKTSCQLRYDKREGEEWRLGVKGALVARQDIEVVKIIGSDFQLL